MVNKVKYDKKLVLFIFRTNSGENVNEYSSKCIIIVSERDFRLAFISGCIVFCLKKFGRFSICYYMHTFPRFPDLIPDSIPDLDTRFIKQKAWSRDLQKLKTLFWNRPKGELIRLLDLEPEVHVGIPTNYLHKNITISYTYLLNQKISQTNHFIYTLSVLRWIFWLFLKLIVRLIVRPVKSSPNNRYLRTYA